MIAWAMALGALKHLVPLPRLVRLMRPRRLTGPRELSREQRVVALAHVAASLAGSAPDRACLTRSLLAYRYLGSAGVVPHLVVGLERGENGVRGHAWVQAVGEPVGETRAALARFVPLVAFTERGEPYRVTDTSDDAAGGSGVAQRGETRLGNPDDEAGGMRGTGRATGDAVEAARTSPKEGAARAVLPDVDAARLAERVKEWRE